MKFYYSVLVWAVIFTASTVKAYPLTTTTPAPMSEETLAEIKSNVINQCGTVLRQCDVVIFRLYVTGKATRAERSALQGKAGQVRQLIRLLGMATQWPEIEAIGVQLFDETYELKVLTRQIVGSKNLFYG